MIAAFTQYTVPEPAQAGTRAASIASTVRATYMSRASRAGGSAK